MKHYAGIDVSLECSSICVVDAEGGIVREDKVSSGFCQVNVPEPQTAQFGAGLRETSPTVQISLTPF